LNKFFLSSGLFPFIEIFNCNGSSKCGIKAVDDAFFKGKFEESNKGIMTQYEAVYTSTNTYGSSQIKGHKYKIILTDAKWNSMFSSLPTKVLHFVQIVNNVGLNQIQDGPSNIDRPDLPKFNNLAL